MSPSLRRDDINDGFISYAIDQSDGKDENSRKGCISLGKSGWAF